MTDMTIATTILEQLGGNKFRAMTGAKDFGGHADALTFRLPATITRDRINFVRITLTPADVYRVEFMKVRGLNITTVSTHDDVYASDLRRVFTSATGLETSLGSMGRAQ